MRTALVFLLLVPVAQAQNLTSNIPYADPGHERQVLDIYAPDEAENLPVVFWIHGGGWQTGDKTSVQIKPRVFTERGFVFVSTNYRLLPHVEMGVLIRDVAKSLGWVHKNIAGYGGDPRRIFVMGHSAGAQLAALLCIDDRYLKAEGVPFGVLKRMRARGRRHLRRAGHHHDCGDPSDGARSAAPGIRPPRQVWQRSQEAHRFLSRHACGQG